MTAPLPSDADSLLVPIHLDAWVVSDSNQEKTKWYEAAYRRLAEFQDPLFNQGPKPGKGVHLSWALPDAVTHGHQVGPGTEIDFPHVPNRWLVLRFSAAAKNHWSCRLWVVESDYLDVGGDSGSSKFLNPDQSKPTQAELIKGTKGYTVKTTIGSATIGKSYSIEKWETRTTQDSAPFLQAVGPGNAAFSAYVPYHQNVFAFLDTEAATDPAVYSYMVVGWYSQPKVMDPMRGVLTWMPSIWKTKEKWQSLTEQQRFQDLLAALRWTVGSDAPASPPSTSLFHGSVFCVNAGCTTLGNADIPSDQVQVAVGNTGADALATLVKSEAAKLAQEDKANKEELIAAGNKLAELLRAAQYDLLEEAGKPGGQKLIDQQAHQAWFGSKPGGTLWEITGTPNATAKTPELTPAQQTKLDAYLAALNTSQRDADQALRELESLQSQLYILWWKLAKLLSMTKPFERPPNWKELVAEAEKLYPQLTNKVWAQTCQVRQKQSLVPQASGDTTLNEAANQWANANWSFPKAKGKGTVTLKELDLQLKAAKAPRFWHPTDPVVLIAGLHRARRRGEDGRDDADGNLLCRLPGKVITGIEIDSITIDASTLGGAVNLDPTVVTTSGKSPLSSFKLIPKIPNLASELFFSDPKNAAFMATVVKLSAGEIRQHLTRLEGAAESLQSGEVLNLLTPGGEVIQGIDPKTNAEVTAGDSEISIDPIDLSKSSAPKSGLPAGSTVRRDTTKVFVGKTGKVLTGDKCKTGKDRTGDKCKIPLQISGTWQGTLPAAFCMRQWEQAWAPLLLDWKVQYYPTGDYPAPGPTPGEQTADRDFNFDDWYFDGQDFSWTGRSGYESDYSIPLLGQALLTPHVQDTFSKKLAQYLADHPDVDTFELETLRQIVLGWDVLTQALSGFTDQLITLIPEATFPPPPDPHPTPAGCSNGKPSGSTPSVTELVGESYHLIPQLEAPAGADIRSFYPVRGGFLRLESLSIVDEFGQEFGGSTSEQPWVNTPHGFVPLFGAGMEPENEPPPPNTGSPEFPPGLIQLPPRVAQPSRLDFHLLGQDSKDLAISEQPNPIHGWLVPNHLDNAISVYSGHLTEAAPKVAKGSLLGEISPTAPDHWRPRPGADPPVKQISDLEQLDPVLYAVVSNIATQKATVFDNLLSTIDETLWMVDPLGGRKDQMLSVLIGRPLAIVEAELALSLHGPPTFRQYWQDLLAADPDIGQIEDIAFPVELGSLELPHDGLIGYFLNSKSAPVPPFFAVHYPETLSGQKSWIRPVGGYTMTADAVSKLTAVANDLLPLKDLTVQDCSDLKSLRTAISTKIGQTNAGLYRSLVINQAMQLGPFPLTATEETTLTAGFVALTELSSLQDHSFATETELLSAVSKAIGQPAADFYRSLIVDLTQRQNRLALKFSAAPVRLTMLVDPRGTVHASSGILPVTQAALPAHTAEQFIKDFSITFRAGPAIFAPGALRFPEPAEHHGTWSWIAPGGQPTPITDADDRARLPVQSMQLREGWLDFTKDD